MNDCLADQIRARFKDRSTEELLSTWQTNDRGEWSNEAFAAMRDELLTRGVTVPTQGAPALPEKGGGFWSRGRIGRKTFWGVQFKVLGASVLLGIVLAATRLPGFLTYIVALPLTLYDVDAQVQRWHDRDKTGWMVCIGLVPILGFIWTLVELGFLEGTAGPNKYGSRSL